MSDSNGNGKEGVSLKERNADAMVRTRNATGRGTPEEGFWLPIRGGSDFFPSETRGAGDIEVWMERDDEYDRFLGMMSFGPVSYHIEAVRLVREKDGTWSIGDADGRRGITASQIDMFLEAMTDGDPPQSFEIDGYDGEWTVVVDAFAE